LDNPAWNAIDVGISMH